MEAKTEDLNQELKTRMTAAADGLIRIASMLEALYKVFVPAAAGIRVLAGQMQAFVQVQTIGENAVRDMPTSRARSAT